MRKRPMLMGACVFLTGICYRNFGGIIWPMMSGILLVYILWPFLKKRQMGTIWILSMILCLLFLGGYRKRSWEEEFRSRYLSELQDGETITIQGEIYYKEQKTYLIYYYLKNTYIQSNHQAVPCNQVIAYMSQDLYPIGTTIIANGNVTLFQEAGNEGNFDNKAFYQSQKIDFAVENLNIKKSISPTLGWQEWLYQLRCRLKDVIIENIGEKEGGVLSGMLLGDKSSLDKEVKETYQEAGISHVLAISALHISIFASGIYSFLRKRGMSYLGTGIISFSFLISYASMTGNGISTQRAAGMFLITIIGAVLGRKSDLLNSLGAVVLYLLWKNPGIIFYAGFQFSVAAVISIGIVNEVRWKREMLHKEKSDGQEQPADERKHFMENFVLSGFIQLGTLPLTAYHYFEVPVYSVFLNVFLLPFMGYLLPLGALGGVCGLFLEFPSKLILLPCKGILWLYEKSSSIMLNFPFSQWITGRPEVWEITAYYVLLFLGIFFWYTGKKKRWIYLADGAAVLLCMIGRFSLPPEISILDVGQGDGIFIQSESGISMFIDGGSSDVRQVGTYRILPFLKSKCIRKIDYWFVSHTDSDHISGLTEVLESGYTIENLVLSAAVPQDKVWEELVILAEAYGSRILYLKQGNSLTMGKETMTCLYPGINDKAGRGDNTESSDRNALSMVLLWESGEFSGIFTGDISEEEEKQILNQYPIGKVDFYKAAHHGSRESNSGEFLVKLQPDLAVISCGENNSYGHPHEETLERLEKAGARILTTPESGEITIQTKKMITVCEFKK